MLTIYEELFLLGIDDEKGVILSSIKSRLAYGLAGAVLAELALQGQVNVGNNRRLEVVAGAGNAEEILGNALYRIQSTEKSRKLTYWIDQLSQRPKRFRRQIAQKLLSAGVLYQEDEQKVRLRPSASTGADASLKYEIKHGLRAAVLANQMANEHQIALLSLVRASKLLSLVFTKDERLAAEGCIHEMVVRIALEKPSFQTIEDIEQAVASRIADLRG